MIENELKQLYINKKLTPYFEDFLGVKNIYIVPEYQFINGIKSDFCIYSPNDEIISIIECKGDDIGVTEYVRGIGQVLQYQYFKENKIFDHISTECKIFLSFPDTLIENGSFNITSFAYPTNTELVIINAKNHTPTIINPIKEYHGLKKYLDIVQISPYYFKDIRIFEMYIILLELLKVSKANPYSTKINRECIGQILTKYDTPNKGNSRNVFIALSSLGLITENNHLSITGYEYAKMELHDFITHILFEYYYPYVNVFFRSFDNFQKNSDKYHLYSISNQQIADQIRIMYNKDVLFVTESDNRYISSWLNCLKDDLLCITFPAKQMTKDITINYNPLYSKEFTQKYLEDTLSLSCVDNYIKEY